MKNRRKLSHCHTYTITAPPPILSSPPASVNLTHTEPDKDNLSQRDRIKYSNS
jgi:hypothetical protein